MWYRVSIGTSFVLSTFWWTSKWELISYLYNIKVTWVIVSQIIPGYNLPGQDPRVMKGSGQEPLPGLGLVVSIEGNYVLCKHPLIFNIHKSLSKYICLNNIHKIKKQFLITCEFFSYSYNSEHVLVCTSFEDLI